MAEKKAQLPTYIMDESHGKYNHLPARWHQYKLFVDFFKDRINKINDPQMKKIATQMLQFQQRGLIHNLRGAIAYERPDLLPSFDQDIRLLYLRTSIIGKCARIIRHPVISFKKLLKKIHEYKRH